MPFERNERPAWWRGAEAAPPMPAELGPWALVATPYGWAWRRPEPTPESDALDPDTAGIIREGMRALDRLAAGVGPECTWGTDAAPLCAPSLLAVLDGEGGP